jgi:hypothetical protein
MTGELSEDLLITGCGEQWFTVVGMFLSFAISRLAPGPTEGLKKHECEAAHPPPLLSRLRIFLLSHSLN